jgi:hypothetical protein
MFFESVDTPDKRRLARSGRTADDDSFAGMHVQINAVQRLKVTKIFAYVF